MNNNKFNFTLSDGTNVSVSYDEGKDWYDEPDILINDKIVEGGWWTLQDLTVSLSCLNPESISMILLGVEFNYELLSELSEGVTKITDEYEENNRT